MKKYAKIFLVFAIVAINFFSAQTIFAEDKPKEQPKTEQKDRDIRDDIELHGTFLGPGRPR